MGKRQWKYFSIDGEVHRFVMGRVQHGMPSDLLLCAGGSTAGSFIYGSTYSHTGLHLSARSACRRHLFHCACSFVRVSSYLVRIKGVQCKDGEHPDAKFFHIERHVSNSSISNLYKALRTRCSFNLRLDVVRALVLVANTFGRCEFGHGPTKRCGKTYEVLDHSLQGRLEFDDSFRLLYHEVIANEAWLGAAVR
jgi:hypothetical protein